MRTFAIHCISILVMVFAGHTMGGEVTDGQREIDAARNAALAAQNAGFNDRFQSTLKSLSASAQTELQASQRRWIQFRDELCALTVWETAARNWPLNLNSSKATCVLQVTQSRISWLLDYRPVVSLAGFSDDDGVLPIREFTLPIGHNSGKRYVEIEIQRELLLRTGMNEVQVGIDNVDGFYALTGDDKSHGDGMHEVLALSVDLDRYQFFWRNRNVPISGDGQPLARGTKPFAVKIKGAVDLQLLLSRGQIRINHGQRPFHYAMPAGYTPWYVPSEKDDPLGWLAPPYEAVGGMDRTAIGKVYWQWLLDRDPSLNPVQDRSGGLCALKQGENFWFLSGAVESDRIERRCQVPYGTKIVIPVIAVVLAFDELGECKKNDRLASLAPYTLQNTWIEINGKRFDRLQDYSASISTCPPLDIAGKLYSSHANWLGLWVPLRPLPRGDHVITFGGRFNAMNFDRKVTYKISVQ